mmetsp:Transcript_34890/g.93286  ORF Transcript_34890/g.93286 Transcript_34890/m.93286 type:complete len:199 (+) Transcript_34890:526-1122(+)
MAKVAALLIALIPAVAAFQPLGRSTPLVRSMGRSRMSSTYVRQMAAVEEAETAEKSETALDYTPIDVEVSDFDEWKIKLGFMDDPRIPEECRVDMMTKIKTAGSAGIVSYALTEGFFWLTSIPIAYGTVWASTGSAPDLGDSEGQKAIGAAAFVLINTARVIVPARIAFALAITPWVDDNIMSKFKKEEATTDDCEVP